jgi:hypothetical protein
MHITETNPLHNKLSSNPSNRSHDPAMGDLQALENEIHMFETTIKSVNTAHNDVLGEIFCLESLFEPLDMDPILDPLFSFKATLDPDIIYHY